MAYFLILILMSTMPLFAKDLGSFGKTFPIEEENLLDVLKQRLAHMAMSEEKQLEIQNSFINSIERPKGKTLPRATSMRIFRYDPTISLKEDIVDHEGKIIVAKGSRVNPLDLIKMREDLLFIDGTDAQQVTWVNSCTGKLILTNGSPLNIEKQADRATYFDQAGYLTTKLGIKFLPARVSQEGNKLKIEEVPCI